MIAVAVQSHAPLLKVNCLGVAGDTSMESTMKVQKLIIINVTIIALLKMEQLLKSDAIHRIVCVNI